MREVEDVCDGVDSMEQEESRHSEYEKLEEPVSFYFLYTEQMCFLSCIAGLT